MKRWLARLTMVILLSAGATGWVCRDGLKARYYVYKLLTATDAEAAGWVDRAGAWGDGLPDRLLDCLATDDAAACGRAGAALARLQTAADASRIAERFAGLSPTGGQAALDCAAALVAGQQPDAI